MSLHRIKNSTFHVARLTLQTETPLSIAAGPDDGLNDNLLVRDANGLPAIPGTSLAGVLRELYQHVHGSEAAERLFGAPPSLKAGQASRIQVSWGYLHDKDNRPIEGLKDPEALANSTDPLIQDALQSAPVRRDHVKLNHRGVADSRNQGKFDRTSLTAGHRFTVEVSLWSDKKCDPEWENTLALFHHPLFCLGGGTRRGQGQMKVVNDCSAIGCFALGNGDGKELERFNELSHLLSDTAAMIAREILSPFSHSSEATAADRICINLTPEPDGFRFGGVGEAWEHAQADQTPLIDKKVVWSAAHEGSLKRRALVFSATNFKGALRHRVSYHHNLLTQKFAEEQHDESLNLRTEKNIAARELFGYVEETDAEDNNDKANAQRGAVLFSDLYITEDISAFQLPHNGIDRFTGGVRDGVLFFEELILRQKPLPEIRLTLTRPKSEFTREVIDALEASLNDLCSGSLALGAGSGRGGHGYFTGDWRWKKAGVEK